MKISSYSKIYNLGHPRIAELFHNAVLIEEKIDGSQFSFSWDGENVSCRSSGQQIDMENPDNLFLEGIETVKKLAEEGKLKKGWVYRGEYLKKPKHNSLAYDRIPKNHIIIFDIDLNGVEAYLPYSKKREEAEAIGLECVPILAIGEIGSYESLEGLLEIDSILGGQKIEGMVVKNYNQFTVDKKTMMGKWVCEKFKEINHKNWKVTGHKEIISLIGDALRTESRWDKAVQHLKERGDLLNEPKDIGALIKEVSKDVQEECQDEIKEKLFKWAWKNISKVVTRGLPEWYKKKIACSHFEEIT
jgi:hypothetical protein